MHVVNLWVHLLLSHDHLMVHRRIMLHLVLVVVVHGVNFISIASSEEHFPHEHCAEKDNHHLHECLKYVYWVQLQCDDTIYLQGP